MWNSVSADPIYTSLDTQYEKIQAEQVKDVTVLYLANGAYNILLFNVKVAHCRPI